MTKDGKDDKDGSGSGSNKENDRHGLDLDNPLVLHSNNLSCVSIVNFKLQGTTNYKVWSSTTELSLRARNKLGFVNGTFPRPTEDESKMRQWDRADAVVLSWLLGINSYTQGSDSLSDYYNKLNSLWKEFDSLTNLGICTCDAFTSVSDHSQQIKLMHFLMGLDESYSTIRSNILMHDPFPSVKSAFATSSREESYRMSSSMSTPNKVPNSAFFGKINDKKRSPNSNTSNNNRSNLGFNPVASMAGVNLSFLHHDIKWVIDSCANQYFTTSDKHLDNVVDISDLKLKVDHPNGSSANILKFGNLSLEGGVGLYDVLVVPTFNVNLMSVHKDSVKKQIMETGSEQGDVRFYEHVIPFKMSSGNTETGQHLGFFDNLLVSGKSNPNDEDLINKSVSSDQQSEIKGHDSSVRDDSENQKTDTTSDTTSKSDRTDDDFHTYSHEPVSEAEMEPMSDDLYSQYNENLISDGGHRNIESQTSGPSATPLGSTLTSDPSSALRRSTRISKPPIALDDYVWNSKCKYSITAMNDEMEALYRNQTWVLTDLPKGRKPIGCKWVYKIKYKSNGDVDRYKARLVAKGYNQNEGVDFAETFSHVAKLVTVRCLITLAINLNWNLHQLDINNAFIYGTIDEDVYMTLPPVYVDDIILTGNNESEINKVKDFLMSKFRIKDLGLLRFFLGIEIIKHGNGVCLCQRKYVLELLHEYGMLGCKPVNTPFDQSTVVSDTGIDENDVLLSDFTGYQKLIGKLIYLTITRPDISYAIQTLSQFMHAPRKSHVKLAMRVLRYLKLNPGKGISIIKSKSLKLIAYVDADWAKCLSTRRSVSGYCLFLGDSLISWRSKKLPTVSRSSTESEYRALAVVTNCEVIWVLKLLKDMRIPCKPPVNVFVDNNSAIDLSLNPVFHERTKHIEVDVHFVRDKVMDGVIEVSKIDTMEQLADIFTKSLGSKQHGWAKLHWAGLEDWAYIKSGVGRKSLTMFRMCVYLRVTSMVRKKNIVVERELMFEKSDWCGGGWTLMKTTTNSVMFSIGSHLQLQYLHLQATTFKLGSLELETLARIGLTLTRMERGDDDSMREAQESKQSAIRTVFAPM
ncbi:hypothetical protein LXL04_025227 [Taraxacum kok-saghyz]